VRETICASEAVYFLQNGDVSCRVERAWGDSWGAQKETYQGEGPDWRLARLTGILAWLKGQGEM